MSSNNIGGPPGGADDPQRDRPLPQADRGPRESSLGLGQPGLLHLFVEEPFEALGAVGAIDSPLRAVQRRYRPRAESARSAGAAFCRRPRLLRTRDALKRIECIREKLPGFDWCQRAVLLGLAAAVKDGQAADALRESGVLGSRKSRTFPPDESIVILAGGCAAEVQGAMDAFKPLLLRACEGLSFTLLGGGTTAGISGLAGDVAQQSGGRVRAFGYLPRFLPRGVQEDLNPAALRSAVQFFGLRFQPAGAAARLDRYRGRRRGPAAREASQLCRRTDLAQRVHPCPCAGGAGRRGRRRGLAERSPVR